MEVASCSRKRKRPLDDDGADDHYEVDEQEDDTDGEARQRIDEALRAQEPETVAEYDGIKVTPFNLEDELEEGYLDKKGDYVFNEKEQVDETNNDTWAESIDWSQVKPVARREITPEPDPVVEPKECYKQMLRIMRSDETVQRTIRRLGQSVPKRRPNKNKSMEAESVDVAEARLKLDSMIGLAHKLLENGDMDIYQKSYDDLEEALND